MNVVRSKPKTERLEARIPSDVKAILVRAATQQGRSLTDFVLGAALEAATHVIRERELLELSDRDQVAFADSLLNPPVAVPALQRAARRYLGESA